MERPRHEANYSRIISAEAYNRMMTEEHLHIKEADEVIIRLVTRLMQSRTTSAEIVEVGTGPLRLTTKLAAIPRVRVTALDYDQGWLFYSRDILKKRTLPIQLVTADIQTYKHPSFIDIVVSQGTHHHIQKGEATTQYLQNIRDQLSQEGVVIISDEMLSHYETESERLIHACIWYAYIVNAALNSRYEELAQAEIETFLDDVFEGTGVRAVKSTEQMQLVRERVTQIMDLIARGQGRGAENFCKEFLQEIYRIQEINVNNSNPLSRGDYKVCFSVFSDEVERAGFRIREAQTIGPIETIGGFGIYVLEKRKELF